MLKTWTVCISLTAFLCASTASTGSVRYATDEVAAAIKTLNPELSRADARRLIRATYQVKSACSIDWKILLAVAFKESSFRRGAVNKRTKDYGLMQINEKTAGRMQLNLDRLMKDEQYALTAGCKVLADNQKRYGNKPYWIGIYRSGTALWKTPIRKNAERYDRDVRLIAKRITDGQNDL